MSHFTCLVIGDNPEYQLAPFHEFECTGENNQYVLDVDKTDEARKHFETDTVRRIRLVDGTLVSPYNDQGEYKREFLRPLTDDERAEKERDFLGLDHKLNLSSDRQHVVQFPDGSEDLRVPANEHVLFPIWAADYYGVKCLIGEETPDRYHKHKYGWVQITPEVKVVKRTNPNAHWDWYQIGGRWTGFFTLTSGGYGSIGTPGLMTEKVTDRSRADQTRKGYIDFAAMRAEKAQKAADTWDKYHAVLNNFTFTRFKTLQESGLSIDEARQQYWNQPAMKALQHAKLNTFDIEDLIVPRNEYVDRAAAGAGIPFAIVKDGQWYEHGSMGWWGCVSDEKDRDEWARQVNALLETVSDETTLTIVDYHI